MVLGAGLIFAGFDIVKMLFWSSVLNGLLTPITILLVVLLTSNGKVMGLRKNSAGLKWLGWTSVLLTGAAAVAMLVTGF